MTQRPALLNANERKTSAREVVIAKICAFQFAVNASLHTANASTAECVAIHSVTVRVCLLRQRIQRRFLTEITCTLLCFQLHW